MNIPLFLICVLISSVWFISTTPDEDQDNDDNNSRENRGE